VVANRGGRWGNDRAKAYIGPGRRPVTEEELELLLGAVRAWRPEFELWFLLAADSGLRRREVGDFAAVDLSGRKLRVPDGKGGVSRWTVATGRVAEALAVTLASDRLRCYRRREPVVGSRSGLVPGRLWPLGYSMLGYLLEQVVGAAGIPADITWHSLRHRFAMKCLAGGVMLHELSDLLGHRWLSSTAVYLHLCEDRFERAESAISAPMGPATRSFLRVVDGESPSSL